MDFELYVEGEWFATLDREVAMALHLGDILTIGDKRKMSLHDPMGT